MSKKSEKAPPHAAEGPVRRPEDMDHAGTGGPYGHTVPGAEEPAPQKGRDKKQR
jgi:hypothetical protein